jgi:hypothetical protein
VPALPPYLIEPIWEQFAALLPQREVNHPLGCLELGVIDAVREAVLEAYDRFIGLELSEVAVDCCITKAPCGGEVAGTSPADRGKRGIKRSTALDAEGIPIGGVTDSARAATTRRSW